MGGEWLSSLQLEEVLSAHPAVQEVAVIGMADPKWGERPLALVVLRPEEGARVRERDLVQHVLATVERGVLARQAAVLQVKRVDAIDKTSVGKVNKRALRDKHL